MEKYHPLDIPRSAYGMMRFPEDRAGRIQAIAAEAVANGTWLHAQEVPLDMDSDYFWAYWLNKTKKPIRKPLLGHETLETEFSSCVGTHFELNGGAKQRSLSLCVAGDLMCTKGLERSGGRLYEGVADIIFGADVRFANLESTFPAGEVEETTFGGGETPKINLTPAQYRTLTAHRGMKYDIVQLANNHILDCGEEGINATLSHLDSDGIRHAGINKTVEDASRAAIIEKCGFRIGWVAHTDSVNFRPLPKEKPWLVNMTPFLIEKDPDLTQILRQIDDCKRQECDVAVVSVHWGLEFEAYPHPQQRQWARMFADAGADIVIGHHPHVIQFSEIVHPQSRPQKDVPVLYSLGNLTPVFSCPESALSLIGLFELERRGGETAVIGLELLPVALVQSGAGGGGVLKLKTLRRLNSAPLEKDMREYVDDMAGYADLILGPSWRQEPRTGGG